jgi:DNA-binding GntR family transcriptional regulator
MTEKIFKAPSLKEQVYQFLKQAITSNQLDKATVYSEKWVADKLHVSRTPVREAILQLKQESFINILPYKGFIIKSLSLEDVTDTFQIRQALEGFCVILISQKNDTQAAQIVFKNLEASLEVLKKYAQEKSMQKFVTEDAHFHRAIILFANNEKLISTYNDIRFRFERITLRVLTEPRRMDTTVEEHKNVLEKMKAGQPWQAFLAMQEHLGNTQKIMKRKSSGNK